MSQRLDAEARENGIRFLIYPQSKKLEAFRNPEIVYLNALPGSIEEGPKDERMYVIDAQNKKHYLEGEGPPYTAAHFPPAKPDVQGHFDYINPESREFSSMSVFATVRRVLDIWEDYFGEKINWFFKEDFSKLEIIPRVEWKNNAQAGYGFIEFGYGSTTNRIDYSNPLCENFDVVAHETGHIIKFSVIGFPSEENRETKEYGGHHEAFGDIVAIISSMHFNSVIDHLLNETKGNLFSVNELSRMGELSQSHEFRKAFNDIKMSDIHDSEEHGLSEPFTGGAFDILVEFFQNNLIEKGLITKELGERAFKTHDKHTSIDERENIQNEFKHLYQGNEAAFKEALLDARDSFGKLIAKAWSNTSPDYLYYWKVVKNIINADAELNNSKYKQTIVNCFKWREISSVNPRLLKIGIVDKFDSE
ncbi:hypothetical protein [Bacillus sp. AY2-1]|uniref:hypothetical protein n=1 Tax=Bacillus sp. AY2-1 TaxID=2217828 RepID=UPI0011EC9470|nr:hypothetical protein [Bacillus sp. AY2-1]KAA0825309.1 hypothetical protein DN403_12340 [Bacillus sp. AY2-1]